MPPRTTSSPRARPPGAAHPSARLCPLPDTEYEIKCVAKRFAAKAPLIRLAAEASETDIKALSESGKLAQYRVLHLATHGLLSGDVARMAQRQGEPALVLTPPDKPADADDDGLLMAWEVAALKLNADWVVMSACNTAAGDKIGAHALSGLAMATASTPS
jgi:CHAT domain-containing protein